MQRTGLLLLVFATWLAPLTAQSSQHSALPARIDSIVNATLRSSRAAGMSVAVVRGNDTVVLRGYGFADVENKVAVSDQSVFRVGSLTKQFTAAAVMKQVEAGRIRLDATLKEYLPDYPGPGGRVTIHQLLNHTSGIPSYTGLGDRFWSQSRLDLSHSEMLDLFARDSLEFAPGSEWRYNNSGYYLLGMVLERVSGQSYAELLKRTQFEPLRLAHTLYCDDRSIVEHRAHGYSLDRGTLVNAAPLSLALPYAAGSLCSTPRDLVRWARALAGGQVVSRESYSRMTTPTTLTSGRTQQYGYGLAPGELNGHALVAHSGGINGFSAFLAHYPAGANTPEPVTIVVLANTEVNTGAVQQQIARAVLNIPEPVAAPEVPLAANQRALYLGTFDLAPAAPMQIQVFEQNGRLMAQATGQSAFPLVHRGNHTFEGPSAIRMVFTIEGQRASSVTVHQGGGTMVAKRVSTGGN